MALKMLSRDGFYGWANLAVMFFFNIAVMLMMMAFAFFLPYWVKEFGWSHGLASGAQMVSIILTGIAAPMVAIFIMKKGTRRAIVTGNILCVAGLLMLAYQSHIWQLYLGFGVLLGLGMSIGGMLAGSEEYLELLWVSANSGSASLGSGLKMHSLAVVSMVLGIIGFAILLFAKSVPLVLAYAVIFGISQGIGSIAMGNIFPDYFGRTEFPKIMGYTMPFNTFISSLGAPVTGYIRDISGSYIPAFKLLLALLAVSFFCILFAKPPKHPSLKAKEAAHNSRFLEMR